MQGGAAPRARGGRDGGPGPLLPTLTRGGSSSGGGGGGGAGRARGAATDLGDASKYELKGHRLRVLLASLVTACIMFFLAARVELEDSAALSHRAARAANPEPRQPSELVEATPTKAGPPHKPGHEPQDSQPADPQPRSEYPDFGFVRKPRTRAGRVHPDDGKLHVIFSSGCNYFQHWQSELLLASAKYVGQGGRITRIVSGCHDHEAESVRHRHQTFPEGKGDHLVPLHELNRSVNDDFGLYITPSFDGAVDFPWINKPSSIDFFMKNAREELERAGETVVAILDPDFVFLRPLSQSETDPANVIATRGQGEMDGVNNPLDWVREGRPVAQRYGLEGAWVSHFDVPAITNDPNSPATTFTEKQARRTTSVGPPLLLHINDLAKQADLWAKYMPRVLKQEVDILADMWAYSIAATDLGLFHTTLDHYMVSTHGRAGQAYPFINEWEQFSCRSPQPQPGNRLPVFIHMASNFKAPDYKRGPWMFHKGHVPPDILDCDSPLLVEPPDNLWSIAFDWKAKQNAWILCYISATLNRVALDYKGKFCPTGFEKRHLVRLIQSKTADTHCKSRARPNKPADKWCYPLAQIEGLPSNWRDELDGSTR